MKQETAVAVGHTSPDEAQPRPGQVWGDAAACFNRWMDGDESGLNDLVAVMTPVLWHVVRAYRLAPDVAEDVIQTTWLALVRRRDAINDSAALGGWLTTTARREAWRVAKKAQGDLPTDDEVLEWRSPATESAETEAVISDERRALWDAVQLLSDRCQRLLRIIAFEDRPDYAKLAEEMSMPVGSIGPTRGRCLEKLRTALSQRHEGELS